MSGSSEASLDTVSTRTVAVEITTPIVEVRDLDLAQRLRMEVRMDGAALGVLELPVCDGRVHERVMRDAIADRFGWRILGEHFARARYQRFTLRREGDSWNAYDADRRVASGLPDDPTERAATLHDAVGWSTLLAELDPSAGAVGVIGHLAGRIARRLTPTRGGPRFEERTRWIVVEVSERTPVLIGGAGRLLAELRVGGTPIVATVAPTDDTGSVSERDLRQHAIDSAGFELCTAVVREALLGLPLSDGTSIRQRLARAARRRAGSRAGETLRPLATTPDVAPGWRHASHLASSADRSALVVANRAPMTAGTSESRYSVLPAVCVEVIAEVESRVGNHLGARSRIAECTGSVIYAPDALWYDRRTPISREPAASEPPAAMNGAATRLDARFQFETLFAQGADPWGYGSDYEQTKYEQTLSLLPTGRFARAMEVACAEGHFTRQLAPRVDSLLAVDVSELALERAAARCAAFDNIEFRQLDLSTAPLPGGFDLLVCSEMLYYVTDRDGLARVARRLIDALVPGGYFVTMHSHSLADSPSETGFDWDVPFGARFIAETFSALADVHLVRELRAPMYRALLFRRNDGSPSPVAERTETDRYGTIPPHSIPHLQWGGGDVRRDTPRRETTRRLPILMYHRVAPNGVPGRERFRVTPDQLERQLRYLRDSGYRSIALDEWRTAVQARRPVDDRAVILTFDDGFQDFAEHAWPLLLHYGFGALAFVVTGAVGRWNDWDPIEPGAEPLMGWETLDRLRAEGLEIGGHTVTHPRLDNVTTDAAALEIARSRAELSARLGAPPDAFAFPYGRGGDAVHHLAGACGYRYAVTTHARRATFADSFLALPRLEVQGGTTFAEFVAMLTA